VVTWLRISAVLCGLLSALHVAAHCGHVELADLLVNHGAIVNTSDYQCGLTPLHLAAQSGQQAIIVSISLCVYITLCVHRNRKKTAP